MEVDLLRNVDENLNERSLVLKNRGNKRIAILYESIFLLISKKLFQEFKIFVLIKIVFSKFEFPIVYFDKLEIFIINFTSF